MRTSRQVVGGRENFRQDVEMHYASEMRQEVTLYKFANWWN